MKQHELEIILLRLDSRRRSEPPCAAPQMIEGEEYFPAKYIRAEADEVYKAFRRLVQERKDITLALRALLDMVDVITESTMGATVLASVHGMEYDGPTYEDVMQWCREALGDQKLWSPSCD